MTPKEYSPMKPRSVYRVAYYRHGTPANAFICAASEQEAAEFVGVRDGASQATSLASPVEVVGLDAPHAALPTMPIFKAPPEPPQQLSPDELAHLRVMLDRDSHTAHK